MKIMNWKPQKNNNYIALISCLTAVICMASAICFTGCTGASGGSADAENVIKVDSDKILIAYFSRAENIGDVSKMTDADASASASINLQNGDVAGNVKLMADYIRDYTKGEEFSIKTTVKYPQDYDTCLETAKQEKYNDTRPELESSDVDFSKYEVIFVGYPIWHEDMPMAIYSFLEDNDFQGKTVIPFGTNSGSVSDAFTADFKKACKSGNVLEGCYINGADIKKSGESVDKWIAGLPLDIKEKK